MSLPVGHALVGSMILAGMDRRLRFRSPRTAWLLALGLPQVPDFDFAFVWFLGWSPMVWHRTFTHSVTFALACGAVAAWLVRRRAGSAGVAFTYVALLVGSHALVDMCGYAPHGPGRGVTLFWPFSLDSFAFPWQFLPPGVAPDLWGYAEIALTELTVLGPPALLVWTWKRWRARRPAPSGG